MLMLEGLETARLAPSPVASLSLSVDVLDQAARAADKLSVAVRSENRKELLALQIGSHFDGVDHLLDAMFRQQPASVADVAIILTAASRRFEYLRTLAVEPADRLVAEGFSEALDTCAAFLAGPSDDGLKPRFTGRIGGASDA